MCNCGTRIDPGSPLLLTPDKPDKPPIERDNLMSMRANTIGSKRSALLFQHPYPISRLPCCPLRVCLSHKLTRQRTKGRSVVTCNPPSDHSYAGYLLLCGSPVTPKWLSARAAPEIPAGRRPGREGSCGAGFLPVFLGNGYVSKSAYLPMYAIESYA